MGGFARGRDDGACLLLLGRGGGEDSYSYIEQAFPSYVACSSEIPSKPSLLEYLGQIPGVAYLVYQAFSTETRLIILLLHNARPWGKHEYKLVAAEAQ
jgi:hypothetical protein